MFARKTMLAAGLVASLLIPPAVEAAPATRVKVGMITTLSGPGSSLGIDIRDGFALALKELGGTLGGIPAEVVEGDDQQKPDVAKQLADRMVKRDGVNFATGIIWSNLALSLMPGFEREQVLFVSPNAGPSQLAGKQCNPFFFNVAFQNDGPHEAMGHHLAEKGVKRVYLMAPNYPAGKDALAGFKRMYKGDMIGEVYTPIGQIDYAPEIAQIRAAAPDAVYVFYPGGMGINFVKQFDQAGLKDRITLYGAAFTLSEDILPAMGDAALGLESAGHWSPDLDTPANAAFTKAFEAAYDRPPSLYAAQGYDTARLIDATVRAAGGDLSDKAALAKAMASAPFTSVRPDFAFNRNHYPIQSYYLRQVVKDDKGRLVNALRGTILSKHGDAYVGDCTM